MSLQELRSHIIHRINTAEDENSLELLAQVADQVLPPYSAGAPGLTDSELAAALRGRAQIANGQSKTHAEMRQVVLAAIKNAAAGIK